MRKTTVNRLTEALTALCVALAAFTLLAAAHTPSARGSLADLRVQRMTDTQWARFQDLFSEARRLVDGNGDADVLLAELQDLFPGRHEVWALSARRLEAQGLEDRALLAYARAVRLDPHYLEEGADLYLGRRIERITHRVMDRLTSQRSRAGLGPEEEQVLKAGYFLRRRLAGGCE